MKQDGSIATTLNPLSSMSNMQAVEQEMLSDVQLKETVSYDLRKNLENVQSIQQIQQRNISVATR